MPSHPGADPLVAGLDRRRLERLAVGAPGPQRRREKRPARRGLGRLQRRLSGAGRHRSPVTAAAGPAPPVPASHAPPLQTAPPKAPLLLIGVGPAWLGSLWVTEAIEQLAAGFGSQPWGLVLVDLAGDPALLRGRWGVEEGEGLSDVLLFGVSLGHASRPLDGKPFRLLPPGAGPGHPELRDPRHWRRLLREAARREVALLVFAPDIDDLAALAPLADGAVLLGEPAELDALRRCVAEAPVVETLSPPSSEPPLALPPGREDLGIEGIEPLHPSEDAAEAAVSPAFEEAAPETSSTTGDGLPGDPPPASEQWPAEGEPLVDAEPLASGLAVPALEQEQLSSAELPEPVEAEWSELEDPDGPPDVEALIVEPVHPPVPAAAPESQAESPLPPPAEPAADVADPVPASAAPDPPAAEAEPPAGTRSDAPSSGPEPEPGREPEPEPELAAPRVRGMTMAQWLQSEEARLLGAEEKRTSRSASRDDIRAALADAPARQPDAARPARPGAPEQRPQPPRPEPTQLDTSAAGPAVESAAPVVRNSPARDAVEPPRRVATGDQGAAATKYEVPRTSVARERFIHVAAILILAYWTYYIGWRWVETVNWEAAWFGVPLVLAETWGLISAYLLVFTTWTLSHRSPIPPPPGLSVDVFITTYDEPLEVIRRTAISAREIRYPHRTFVLDDGRRSEVQAMAQDLGVEYLRREDNADAKAGNLNHALAQTRGDFILQLDADHAPLPHILDRMLGFFEDPRVAFVQSPQDFYNTDSFTSDVNESERRIWEEQRLFFSVIQPGKDRWNSAFFCGSCAVIRRSALDQIGGFSSHSITEDIETSMLLHARGWKSVYYGESLAYGLAAGSAEAFHTQHMRWAQGAMQVLRKFSPLTQPGLTLAQRLGYFYSLTAYVVGLQKLILFAAPLVFFFTGVLPVRAVDREFLIHFVPYLVLSITLIELLSRGLGFTWITERYQMAKFWTYSRALVVYFTRRRLPFKVTPKGPGHVPPATYMPQLLLLILTVLAVNWASLAYAQGWVDYGSGGWRSIAFQANFVWAAINFTLAAHVVRLSARLHQQRQDHRFSDRFPIHLRPRGPKGRLGEPQIALTEDLNASGLAFRSVMRFDGGTELRLTLPLTTGEVVVNGTVVHVRADEQAEVPIYVHGVEFTNVPLNVRDGIELHCAHYAVPIEQMRYHSTSQLLTRAQDWMRNARREPRRSVRLPTWVLIGGDLAPEDRREHVAFLEEVSAGGARLIMDRPVAPGTRVVFEVPGAELRGEGRAVFSRALETPIGVRFAVGVRRDSQRDMDTPPGKKMRIPRLWRATGAPVAVAVMLGLAAPGADAQIQTAIFGTAEADTEETSLFLLGASAQPSGLGIVPTVGVLAYHLIFPLGISTASLTAVLPSAGLRYQTPVGAVQATAGYLFLTGDTEGGFGAPGGAEQGVVVSAMADYWGTGAQTAQLIGSFNLADQYFWGRARAAQRVLGMGATGALRVGAEAVLQGGGDEVGGDYQAFQAGPVVELQLSPAFRLTGVVGAKTDNIVGNSDLFPYFKLEFVVVP